MPQDELIKALRGVKKKRNFDHLAPEPLEPREFKEFERITPDVERMKPRPVDGAIRTIRDSIETDKKNLRENMSPRTIHLKRLRDIERFDVNKKEKK